VIESIAESRTPMSSIAPAATPRRCRYDRPSHRAQCALWRRREERLGEADFVILTTPETPDTLGMFNARLFSRMKRGAYFINIARGRCVVTQDLIAALQSGQLAGAGLDVADPEPLPPDSPLWSLPNVLITLHVAILGTPYRQKWEAILLENCRRFAAGQPLRNVVDKEKWY
jgi:phosphoglycerate dehydrogenase-like enzyme